MKKFLVSFLFLPIVTNALDLEQLSVLREAVKEMCVYPDRAGNIIRLEGDAKAGLPVPIKIVKAELSGKVSFEAWTGIPIALDKYKTDPRQCSLEMVKILLPTFEPLSAQRSPEISPTIRGNSNLFFENKSGPIFNPDIKIATWMRTEITTGSGCPDIRKSARKILLSPATYGTNADGSNAPFSFNIGQAHEWTKNIVNLISNKTNILQKCILVSFETYLKLTFDDSKGSSLTRNYKVLVSSDTMPSLSLVSLTIPLLFEEASQTLESAQLQNQFISLPLALEDFLKNFE